MGLATELTRRMESLLASEPFDQPASGEIGDWFEAQFRTNTSRTPPGTKEAKKVAETFRWWLRAAGGGMYNYDIEVARKEVARWWAEIQKVLPLLVRGYTEEGGTSVPVEVQVGGNTYVNQIGFTSDVLQKWAHRFQTLFDSIRGWRQRAFKGGLRVVFARPDSFRGTSKGVYRTQEDALYIRAIPAVLKRGTEYGGAEYIVVHELGHRYERKNHLPRDFDHPQWWTTAYSKKEGEAFAELFALGHFGTVARAGSWNPATSENFEKLMTSGETPEERVASRWLARST